MDSQNAQESKPTDAAQNEIDKCFITPPQRQSESDLWSMEFFEDTPRPGSMAISHVLTASEIQDRKAKAVERNAR